MWSLAQQKFDDGQVPPFPTPEKNQHILEAETVSSHLQQDKTICNQNLHDFGLIIVNFPGCSSFSPFGIPPKFLVFFFREFLPK